MAEQYLTFLTMSHYFLPPLLGAFIGYLTNKVAIRMLFRPLKKWRLLGITVPMTPGVIPSKRHMLARNIGDMVGSHLLTSEEIGKGLEKPEFKKHLAWMIKNRVGAILEKKLPSLPQLIPAEYHSNLSAAQKSLNHHIAETVIAFIKSNDFEKIIHTVSSDVVEELMEREVGSFVSPDDRTQIYNRIDGLVASIAASRNLEIWLDDYVYSKIVTSIREGRTLRDVLPEPVVKMLVKTIEQKTPDLLHKLSQLLTEPDIQEKLIRGIQEGVESFAETLGPMGSMVQGFLNYETIEKAVKQYLDQHRDDIATWSKDKTLQEKFSSSIMERVNAFLDSAIGTIFSDVPEKKIEEIGTAVSSRLIEFVRHSETLKAISSLIRDNCEIYLEAGSKDMGSLVRDVFGASGQKKGKAVFTEKLLLIIRSDESAQIIETLVQKVMVSFLARPIGKVGRFFPENVREKLYGMLSRMSSSMLGAEVPGLVSTLNIQRIVAEKIDTLDLLKLEDLLLSIMEEQFKYINLFGALLGFLIGCVNLIVIIGMN